jgi:DNA polymerase sigma
MMVVKQSELDVNINQGPTIYLPETQKMPDEYSALMIEKKKELTH